MPNTPNGEKTFYYCYFNKYALMILKRARAGPFKSAGVNSAGLIISKGAQRGRQSFPRQHIPH